MSDEALRELERRAQASGAADDQAAWLRARRRAGELSPQTLALLAHLGDAGARALLRDEALRDPTPRPDPPRPPVLPGHTRAFLVQLWRHDPDPVAAQTDGAMLGAWVRGLTELAPDDWELEGRAALAAAELLILPPEGQELLGRLRPWLVRSLLASDAGDADSEYELAQLHGEAEARGHHVLARLVEATPGPLPFPFVGEPPGGALREVVVPLQADRETATRTRRAIEQALVPWLLGSHDPLSPSGHP